MDNMSIYNNVRSVPESAQKKINGGRLSGMTDINPMWRIQKLTEEFGPCGVGWKYVIRDKRLEPAGNDEIAAFVDIDLFFHTEDGWSEAIPGTGGSSFAAKERSGLHVSDECYKMALTDALSVACKAIGMGADIYWEKGSTKYDRDGPPPAACHEPPVCGRCGGPIFPITKNKEVVRDVDSLIAYTRKTFQMALCYSCMNKLQKEAEAVP